MSDRRQPTYAVVPSILDVPPERAFVERFTAFSRQLNRNLGSKYGPTHAKVLDLPSEASAYGKRPWRCLRDVVAAAEFTAEERLLLCALQ